MIPEEKLTPAEEKVLAAFRTGDSKVSVKGEVRGDFLRGLFLDEKADYRGTYIVGAIISDVLDMEFCETRFPVRFHGCSFAQEIKLQQLTCPELDFSGCALEKGIDALGAKVAGGVNLTEVNAADQVRLSGADIGGQLGCDGGSFQNERGDALNAQGIKVAEDVFLGGGFNAEGKVSLSSADIGGQLNCTGGSFQNKKGDALNAQGMKVAETVFLGGGFNAEGKVSLSGADIGGQLDCAGGSFQNERGDALNAQNIRVASDVFLGGGFNARGAVSLSGADIGGQLNCTGGSFQNERGDALNAQGIKVAEDVFLGGGFVAEGEVRLSGADIGGQLSCTGGSFQNERGNALIAQSIKVAADAFLHGEFKGAVSLAGADIEGQLSCAGGSFQNERGDALNAQGMKVASDVFLGGGFKAEGAVSLSGADIGGQLSCTGGIFRNEGGNALVTQNIKVTEDVFLCDEFRAVGAVSLAGAEVGQDLILRKCEFTHLSLAGANVSGEFRDEANVYKGVDLNIDGFRYQRLNAAKERVKDRLAWVGLMSKGGKFYPQPYEQLMQVYRAAGHTNWARDVGFELEKKRQEVMESWLWKGWYSVLRLTIGYGYKPFRVLVCWFVLVVVGLALFSGILPCPDPYRTESAPCHCMAPSDAEVLLSEDWKIDGKIPKDYPNFNFVYYAVEAVLPVLPLGQTENWHPKTWWVRWLQGAITIIGALILAILASYGVGVLGPRWKNE
ncbi:MAG: hypothetical protein OXU94_06910 [Gammaproteobacteria bacterium]|nr:hypothetical protein [Gammaproteobacteria bacterium]